MPKSGFAPAKKGSRQQKRVRASVKMLETYPNLFAQQAADQSTSRCNLEHVAEQKIQSAYQP